jgi:hypothetical protein
VTASDPELRRQIAALGADASWANTPDWTARTSAARAARFKQYEAQVDPDNQLDPVTRAKRAEKAMNVHMRQMSRKGVEARKRNAAARQANRRQSKPSEAA